MTLKSKKRFVDGRTDVRTCVRTDIWDRLYQIDSVEESILKGSIADLSPLVDVNGFVRSWLPSNTCSSISRKSDHQMASQSVQPLLYSTSVWPKHKQTDTHTHTHTQRPRYVWHLSQQATPTSVLYMRCSLKRHRTDFKSFAVWHKKPLPFDVQNCKL